MPFSCSFFGALESCSNSPKTGAKSLSATGCYPSPKESTHRLTGRNMGHFGWGWYHYPRTVSHVSETLRGQGVERQTLPLLGLGRGCSRRTQKAFGTAMRLCVSLSRRRRGPAGLRDLFRFCRNCGLYALFQILLSVLQTLQLVLFLCKLRLGSFLVGSELFKGFRFSRRSSLCCSCASCVSARSFSVLVFARKTTGDYFSRTPISARSWSRGLGFAIVLDLLF